MFVFAFLGCCLYRLMFVFAFLGCCLYRLMFVFAFLGCCLYRLMFVFAFLGWYHSFYKLACAGLTLWPLKAYVCHRL